jgi:large subunit ribosomal protein L9
MKVLLHDDVDGLGYLGDVVEVSDGYARNYLIPKKIAVQPTEANIKTIQKERAKQVEIRDLARKKLVKVAEEVNGAQVSIVALANEQGHLFGSVGPDEIARSLQEKGFEVRSKQVRLQEHIRELGEYEVKLHFAENVDAAVQVQVVQTTEQEDGNQEENDDKPE